MNKTLEDYATEYADAKGLEAQTLWVEADIVAEFERNCIGGGAARKEHKASMTAFASIAGDSVRTLEARIKTARAFPEEKRVKDIAYSTHQECARTRDPQGWLDKTLENGWNITQLRAKLKEASGKVGNDLKAVLEHLEYYGLGTEEDIAVLSKADSLVIQGVHEYLRALRSIERGQALLRPRWELARTLMREIRKKIKEAVE